MQSIKVKSHVDRNGILSLSLPEIRDTDVEVTIVYQLIPKIEKQFLASLYGICAEAAHHGASNVRIFGSVARGEEHKDSDVDFLVDMESDRSLLDRIGLIQDLEDLLERKVDVATVPGLRDYFRERILSQAIPL